MTAPAIVMLVALLMGASPLLQSSTSSSPGDQAKGINPETTRFAKVYRSGKAIQGAVSVGVNRPRISQLLQEAATELAIVRDLTMDAVDQEIYRAYSSALATFVEAVDCCWTAKSYGEEHRAFQRKLGFADHQMENAHRRLRGLPTLPAFKEPEPPPPVVFNTKPGFKARGWIGKGGTKTATELFDVPLQKWEVHWSHKGRGRFTLQVCDDKRIVVAQASHVGSGDGVLIVESPPGRFYLIPTGDEWAVRIATEAIDDRSK